MTNFDLFVDSLVKELDGATKTKIRAGNYGTMPEVLDAMWGRDAHKAIIPAVVKKLNEA